MAKKLVPISTVAKFGDALARSLRANLQWSKQLRNSVRLEKVKTSGTITSVTVSVGAGEDKSGNPLGGMARAYEYGSGLQGNFRKKYLIKPRLKKALWFYIDNPYEGVKIYEKPSGEIGITVPYVMHPGVSPRPYFSKSLATVIPRMAEELRVDIRKNIMEELNVAIRKVKDK